MKASSGGFVVEVVDAGVSPGGTMIVPFQTLKTSQGVWSFGAGGQGGGNVLLLNGTQASSGSGVKLKVGAGFILYTFNSSGNWYRWTGNGWAFFGTTEPT